MLSSADDKSTPASDEPQGAVRELSGLEVKVSTLEGEVQKLRNEGKSWAKRVGVILGVLGGLIAVPKGINDAWNVIHASPKTSISWGQPIRLSFDPGTSILTFTFNLTATNDGSLSDHVDSASVELKLPQAQSIFLSEGDVQMSGATIPFALAPNQPKDIVVSVQVSRALSAMALREPGSRVLDFSLVLGGRRQTLSQKYCIPPFDADDLQSILNAHPRRALYALCN